MTRPATQVVAPPTPAQARVLDVIRTYYAAYRAAPSYEDIAKRAGLRSLSTVSKHLDALESRGHISRVPPVADGKHPARSMTLTAGRCPCCAREIQPAVEHGVGRRIRPWVYA